VIELFDGSEYLHAIDHCPMTLGFVIQVPGKSPALASRIQRPDRIDGLPPETACPNDNELTLRGRSHGTDIAGVESASSIEKTLK
jgi:hypothetical protein